MSHFAATIRSTRKSRGMTQQALADASDAHYQQVQQWERGRRSPSIATIVRLARALGIPPARLAAAAIRDHTTTTNGE
jgi:transcriptional regulator with XRE-family HTH domain